MSAEIFNVIQLVASISIVPLLHMVYRQNERLSRIEGRLDTLYPRSRSSKSVSESASSSY